MQYIDGVVKWGIIGCGDVCEVKSGPAFSKVPNSKLVAVIRRNKNKAEDYAKRHVVGNQNARLTVQMKTLRILKSIKHTEAY